LSRPPRNSSAAAESEPFVLPELDDSSAGRASKKKEAPFEPSVFDPEYAGPLPWPEEGEAGSLRHQEPTPEDILNQARDQAETIAREARQEGFEAGLAEGRHQGQREVDRLTADLARLIESLSAERRRLFDEAEKDLIGLVIAFGRRVVGTELAGRPESITDTVRRAVTELLATKVLKIRLHPEDAPLVEPIVEELSRAAGGARVELSIDPHLTRGGALVETETQEVDARLETRLNELGRDLRDELVRSQGAATAAPPEPAASADGPLAAEPAEAEPELPDLEWGDPVPVDDLAGDDKDVW
jgi:flagellar assembly protein FliH